MNVPKVSIVIVSYNVKHLLRTCLLSIQQTTNDIFKEIFVVDNASTDGTVEMLNMNFPEVQVLANQVNKGFPIANNQAFILTKGKYIFMLNPDTVVQDDALQKMISYLDEHEEISLLAPCLLNPDKTIQQSIQRFITVNEIVSETFYLHQFVKAKKSYFRSHLNEPLYVEALSGAAILFRKNVIEQIGMLDEDLFWTEDMEFCYRAYKKGLRIVYFPSAKIIHYIGASGQQNLNAMISNQILTKVIFFKKNHPYWQYLTVLTFRFLHIISRLFILTITSIIFPSHRNKAKAYAFTFFRFITNNY